MRISSISVLSKVLLVVSLATIQVSAFATQDECKNFDGQVGINACLEYAQQILADEQSLLRFASDIERTGSIKKSLAVYKLGAEAHPNSRALLKKYIRLRRQAKAADLIDTHGQQTVAAHIPFVGRTAPALTDNRHSSVAEEATQSLANAATAPPLVQKLQLLQNIFERQLIDEIEYKRRRSAILGEEFGDAQPPVLSTPVTQPSGSYYALIVGNDQYQNFIRLRSPVNDAQVVEAVLRNRYGFKTKMLTNATRYEILVALSKLRTDIKEQDSLLIYYAGHGFLDEKTRRGYWLPVDAERDNVANWIPTTDITDALAGIAARHALVVADSCFSGTLLREADTGPHKELLQRLASRKSRTVLTSGGLEPVLDDGDGKHSVFARIFLDALRENQGVMEAGRLFLTLRDRVALNADQTPQYAPIRNAGHEGGDFIFIRQ